MVRMKATTSEARAVLKEVLLIVSMSKDCSTVEEISRSMKCRWNHHPACFELDFLRDARF